jgi:hypothetical protein
MLIHENDESISEAVEVLCLSLRRWTPEEDYHPLPADDYATL